MLQAKVLALLRRGGDIAVAHLERGEMVVPRHVLTPELMQFIAAEAANRGIDPKQLIVDGRQASIIPATGTEEYGLFDGDDENELRIEPIEVAATRRVEKLGDEELSAHER